MISPKKFLRTGPDPFSCGPRQQEGFALIIVLAVVVLLLALVVGFFSRVLTETKSSATHEASASAQNLKEQAVNVVMAQIKTATAGFKADGGGNLDTTQPLAWASQPGMVRTFDNRGNLAAAYKLYSAPELTTSTYTAPAIPPDWNNFDSRRSFNALWCDLNAPVQIPGDADSNGTIAQGEKIPAYPILDPNAEGTVKGFSLTARPGYNAAFQAGSYTTQKDNSNPAPMPVQWLYLLERGQLVAPGGGPGSVTVAGASKDNPIVGRIAFWTDDETSKINVNTAGGGPWDEPNITVQASTTTTYSGPGFSSFTATPLVNTTQDYALATNQPAQFEYQRYPGHPATTFLSAALPGLDTLDKVYALTPRLANEGSRGGSTITANSTVTRAPVKLDAERLYGSVGELAFDPARNATPNLKREDLERAKFFLTAHSRAPEVNLFNEPRICLWPINKETDKRTGFDRLIAFCDTINEYTYYFERSNPDSETEDLNLGRNREIRDYLRNRTSTAVPGFGGGTEGILGKYGSGDRDQTITEIFDYIRSTNTRDSSQGDTKYHYAPTGTVVPIYDASSDTRGFGRFPTITKVGIMFYGVGINNSTDPNPPAYPPEARRKTIPIAETVDLPEGKMKMRAILFLEMFVPGQGTGMIYPRFSVKVDGLNSGANTLTWNNQPIFPAAMEGATLSYVADGDWKWGPYYRNWGGRIGLRALAGKYGSGGGSTYPLASPQNSPEVDCPSSTKENPTFKFGGSNLTLRVMGPNGNEVQTLTVPIPSDPACPVPDLAPLVAAKSVGGAMRDFRDSSLRLVTTSLGGNEGWDAWITKRDVVRAVAVDPADYRITAAKHTVPGTFFQPHPFYFSHKLAHNFLDSVPIPFHGAGLGTYVDEETGVNTHSSESTYPKDGDLRRVTFSDWDSNLTDPGYEGFNSRNQMHMVDTYSVRGVKVGGVMAAGALQGDWDLGIGMAPEGPYINYADEGSIATMAGYSPYFGDTGRERYMDEVGPSNFSPNRMMPSSVMLGSLPSAAKTGKAWQTLLFRATQAGHPGSYSDLASDSAVSPSDFNRAPDYLLLDLFNMPVVEPYAISEPLSTAGKVNMNYQLAPFTYIDRSTAVQAVLRSEQMLTLPNNATRGHKYRSGVKAGTVNDPLRSLLNLDETLKGFQRRFANNDVFRSPAEICSIWLVPRRDGATYEGMAGWWDRYRPTADNARESSYARLYPRLTTKSNTFTVHYRVQSLKKVKSDPNQAQWTEGRDKVMAEQRGSSIIERYVDPNDPGLPDYLPVTSVVPLDDFYKFRVISDQQFNP